MKQLLLWLIGVALGVVVLLAAVLGVSYSFTSEGAKPASEVQFAGQELEPNGWCWQVPLLGGQVDKVFASPRTLTVQKLGILYDAHPAFALPEWYSYGPLTITDSAGNVVFEGTAATYDDFLFPANGGYKAELTVWRLPENMLATQFEGGSTGELRRDVRLEKPAKPIGWYNYSFRFTLQAAPRWSFPPNGWSRAARWPRLSPAWWVRRPPRWKQTSAMCRPSVWAAGGAPISRRPTMPLPVRMK